MDCLSSIEPSQGLDLDVSVKRYAANLIADDNDAYYKANC